MRRLLSLVGILLPLLLAGCGKITDDVVSIPHPKVQLGDYWEWASGDLQHRDGLRMEVTGIERVVVDGIPELQVKLTWYDIWNGTRDQARQYVERVREADGGEIGRLGLHQIISPGTFDADLARGPDCPSRFREYRIGVASSSECSMFRQHVVEGTITENEWHTLELERVTVEARETLDLPAGRFETFRIRMEYGFFETNRTARGEEHTRIVWYSPSACRDVQEADESGYVGLRLTAARCNGQEFP